MSNSTDGQRYQLHCYYCSGMPGHYSNSGVFGIINPPNIATGSNMTLSTMMPAKAVGMSYLLLNC
ncbi:hypothetical protein M404DRAFT_1004304 [Pisolithus tinctorius Marx 270]|uniref:Uncharacterized protein n=1 Tax=Pisolithus tinctorius Marx 270 TaxID=870435 RepID=A0A0C3ISU9_PISTI|nr:hypothetical protein M404DRAFT_1004304 [Pisolithus tinctorius Marx 270]